MRSFMASCVAIALATAGSAQLVGGSTGVGGIVQGTLGGVGGAGGTVGGTAGAAVNAPDASVSDVTRPVGRAARDTTRATTSVADRTAAGTVDAFGKPVRVEAGTSVRVAQGTRCYYDDYYFDPTYRDGYYYCERTGPGVAAGARVRR